MKGLRYLVQQPKTLESLALKEFVTWIVTQVEEKLASPVRSLYRRYPFKAEEFISRHAAIIRSHVECRLPAMFHDKLMVVLMEGLGDLLTRSREGKDVPFNLIVQIVEILFTKSLTSLTLRHNRLGYKGALDWLKPKFHLISGLTHLTIALGCTDKILECVAKNCKLIKSLDLHFSERISDSSIDILVRFSNLRIIDLGGTSVSETGIKYLLKTCPNIERIDSVIDIAGVIYDNIANIKGQGERRFNLKYYNDYESERIMKLHRFFVKVCPLIEKLDLFRLEYLNVYHRLQNLRELSLCQFYFFTNKVKELLEAKGSNLVSLHFISCSEITDHALQLICVACPKLQNLSFKSCYFEEEIWNDADFSGKDMSLKYLNKLKIADFIFQHGKFERFFFLIYNCPNIEYIVICALNDRTCGDVISEVLEANPNHLKYLKEMRISGHLSESVVRQLVQNSINPLEVVTNTSDDHVCYIPT